MSQPREGPGPEDDREQHEDEEPREFEDMVDEESADSFPASDPPSFTPDSGYGAEEEHEETDDDTPPDS